MCANSKCRQNLQHSSLLSLLCCYRERTEEIKETVNIQRHTRANYKSKIIKQIKKIKEFI